MTVEEKDPLMCGRCYDEVLELFEPNCVEKPELRTNLGQYHCPECGAMLLGGLSHFQMCKRCIKRQHPVMDRTS